MANKTFQLETLTCLVICKNRNGVEEDEGCKRCGGFVFIQQD